MAATKRQMNWSAVGFTPSGGSLTTITGVTEIQIDPGGALATFKGDVDVFDTTIVNHENKPKVTVRAADVATIQGLAPGTVGALAATFKDAKKATGGDILYAIANAVVENTPGGGQHAAFGEATLSLACYSSDGATSPISFTRA
jgi:hypothetical protein